MLKGNNLVSILLFKYNISIHLKYYKSFIVIITKLFVFHIIIFQVIYIKYKYFIANCIIKISVSVYFINMLLKNMKYYTIKIKIIFNSLLLNYLTIIF